VPLRSRSSAISPPLTSRPGGAWSSTLRGSYACARRPHVLDSADRAEQLLATAFDPPCGARGTDPVEVVAARLGAVAVEVNADRPASAAARARPTMPIRREFGLFGGRCRHGAHLPRDRLRRGRLVRRVVPASEEYAPHPSRARYAESPARRRQAGGGSGRAPRVPCSLQLRCGAR